MNQSILRAFISKDILFVGKRAVVNAISRLINKWSDLDTSPEILFDDGLIYNDHCLSLYLQNDSYAWAEFKKLCERTKKQGKTLKTLQKKRTYFTKGFNKLISNNPQLLQVEREKEKAEGTSYCDRFSYSEGLVNWWFNYYLQVYDAKMNADPVEVYPITHNDLLRSKDFIIGNANALEKNNRGNVKPPKFTVSTSKINMDVRATTDECWIEFRWERLSNAAEMMGKFQAQKYRWDHDKPSLTKLKKAVPNARIECMDCLSDMYGNSNNWFYVCFHWNTHNFTWAEARKAEQAVKKLVSPHLGTFRPSTEKEKYSVVSLTF